MRCGQRKAAVIPALSLSFLRKQESSVVIFAFVCHPRPRSGIQCRFPDEQEEKKKPLDSRLLTSGMTEGGKAGMTEGGKARMTEGER